MKKILFTILLVSAVVSCKNNSEKNNDSDVTQEKTVQDSAVSSAPVKSAAADLKILTVPQASEFLNTRNDTLYVTNFFATWCGPCVREIPHFKDKITELSGKPVKISFISMDTKDAWTEKVPSFVDTQDIRKNTYLLDGGSLDAAFFSQNFKKWDGSAIPFTYMRKGEKTDEFLGMMTAELLDEKINKFLGKKSDKKIKLDDDYVAGTIGVPEKM